MTLNVRREYVVDQVGSALHNITQALTDDAAQAEDRFCLDLSLAQVYIDEAFEAAKAEDGGHDGNDFFIVKARQDLRTAIEYLKSAKGMLEAWEQAEGI